MPSRDGEPAADQRRGHLRASTQTKVGRPSHELVAEFQRERILEATVQLIAERGLRHVTTASVTKRAGVARRTLNNLFGSIDDCAAAAVTLVRRRATSLVSAAFAREDEWTDGVLTGLAALLDFLDREPQLAWVCLVETLTVNHAGLTLRANELAALAPLLDAGRTHAMPGELSPPPLTAEATIASVTGILHTRLVTGKAPPFIDLLGPLASVALSPYLDGSSLQSALDRAEHLARSIAAERPPRTRPTAAPPRVEIPKKVRSPSAYRVRQSLLHIANHRGVSNTEIARAIGVPYSSQISALLTRLERDGLLAKHSGGIGRPSAWRLTPYGESVASALADEDVTRGA